MRIAQALLDDIVAEVAAAKLAAASPFRYEIDPKDQLRIELAIEDAGCDLGGIYHSHTRSEPFPSQTDINLAFYPDAVYVIVGVAGAEPEVRAFQIVDRQVGEVALDVAG